MRTERIEELKKRIAELESRWPAHSVPPAMLEQLEELEEELVRELKRSNAEPGASEGTDDGGS